MTAVSRSQTVDQAVEEGDKIIKSITNCVDRGEIEKGIRRGKCHVFLDHSNRCACGDKDLSKYQVRKTE